MWVYWDIDHDLTMKVLKERSAIDHRGKEHSMCVAYCFLKNALYSLNEGTICHLPKVTSLKEIDEIRLMYSLGLTEKDM